MIPPKDNPSGPVDRRDFFADLFERVSGPLTRFADRLGRLENTPAPSIPALAPALALRGDFLRPPGALPEDEFFRVCIRSGQCVQACPVHAIKVSESEDPSRRGLPAILPTIQACVVCEDLSCMKACPSGALRLVPRESIRIGLAVVKYDSCLRSDGEECRICVDKCPIGGTAIALDEEGIVTVKREGCVGCGVCSMECPSKPRAITILPLGFNPHSTSRTPAIA